MIHGLLLSEYFFVMIKLSSVFSWLHDERYYATLFILLGIAFQLSMAATNSIYYLILLSAIVYFLFDYQGQQKKYRRAIVRHPLWLGISIWVALLYLSGLYSNASQALLGNYATKYIKYTLLFFLTYLVLSQLSRQIDLPRYFFRGFMIGGMIVFILGMLNKATGWLSWLAAQGWLPEKYVTNNYWISNELFAHSFFFALLFTYGLIAFLRKKRYSALLICAISLFEVFVVSEQRTGFIAIIVICLWLLWLLLPGYKQKLTGVILILFLIGMTLLTDQAVSQRIFLVFSEVQHCLDYLTLPDGQLQELGKACYSSSGLRLLFWHDALVQFSHAFFYGHGLANLDIASITYDWQQQYYIATQAENPHNEYLLQAVQLGIIGLGLLCFIFLTAFRQSLGHAKQRRYLYASTVLMYSVTCLFNSFLLDTLQGLFFTLLAAFIIAESITHQEKLCDYPS